MWSLELAYITEHYITDDQSFPSVDSYLGTPFSDRSGQARTKPELGERRGQSTTPKVSTFI